MNATTDTWDEILGDGESILWQGRPDARIIWGDILSANAIAGGLFVVFASVWLSISLILLPEFNTLAPGLKILFYGAFPLLGGVFLCLGLYMMVGWIFRDAFVRSRTYYSLSNLNAYIATDLGGRRTLKRYEIDAMERLDLDDGAPGSVWFATEIKHYKSTRKGRTRHHTHETPIGFRRIENPRAVYRLLSDLTRRDDSPSTRR